MGKRVSKMGEGRRNIDILIWSMLVILICILTPANAATRRYETPTDPYGQPGPYCGDGECNNFETCYTCSIDNCCDNPNGPNSDCDGDGVCDPGETELGCPGDCYSGNPPTTSCNDEPDPSEGMPTPAPCSGTGSCGPGELCLECGSGKYCINGALYCGPNAAVGCEDSTGYTDVECTNCQCMIPTFCMADGGRCPDTPEEPPCCPGTSCITDEEGFDRCMKDDCECKPGATEDEELEGEIDIGSAARDRDCDSGNSGCGASDCKDSGHAVLHEKTGLCLEDVRGLKLKVTGGNTMYIWELKLYNKEGEEVFSHNYGGECVASGDELVIDEEDDPAFKGGINVDKVTFKAHDAFSSSTKVTLSIIACSDNYECDTDSETNCPGTKYATCWGTGTQEKTCSGHEWGEWSDCEGGNPQFSQEACEEYGGEWQDGGGCCGGDGYECGHIAYEYFCTGGEWASGQDEFGCMQSCDSDEPYLAIGNYWQLCGLEMGDFAILEGTENSHSYLCHEDEDGGFDIYECKGMDMQPVCSGGEPPTYVLSAGESVDLGGEQGAESEPVESCISGRAVVRVSNIPQMDDNNKDEINKQHLFCLQDENGIADITMFHRYLQPAWPVGPWHPAWRIEAGGNGCNEEWWIFNAMALPGSDAEFEIEWTEHDVTVTHMGTGESETLHVKNTIGVASDGVEITGLGVGEDCRPWGWKDSGASAEIVESECYQTGYATTCGGGTASTYSGIVYCMPDGTFGDDLDTPEEQNTPEIVAAKESACEAAGETFTGTYCCSEVDDDITYDTPSETAFWQNFDSIKGYLPSGFPQGYDLESNESYFDTQGVCWFGKAYDSSADGELIDAYTTRECKEQDGECGFTLECCEDLYCFNGKCQDKDVIEELEDTYKIEYDMQRLSDMHLSESVLAKQYGDTTYLLGCDIYKNLGDFKNPVTGEIDKNKPFQSTMLFTFMQNYPDPGDTSTYLDARNSPLVANIPACALSDTEGLGGGYYCSYLEYWKEVPEEWSSYFTELDQEKRELLKPKLSWIAWAGLYFSSANQSMADCCLGTSCWDGEKCVEDMSRKPSEPGINPDFRCIAGLWISQALKYNWDMTLSGYCREDSWCLVDPAGDPDYSTSHEYYNNTDPSQNPTCIQSGDYIEDHYCEDGKWTTRTKILAEALLAASGSSDGTLHCDKYDEAEIIKIVNNVEYELNEDGVIPLDIITDTCEQGVKEAPCLNNLCVLRYGDSVAFATTFSGDQSIEKQNVLQLLRKDESYCNAAYGQDGFVLCSSRDGYTYYNEKLGALVHSSGSLGFGESLADIFTGWFKDFLGMFYGPDPYYPEGPDGELDFTFVANTSSYNQIYVLGKSGKTVAAVREDVYSTTGPVSYLGISYDGFDSPMCSAINNLTDYACFEKSGRQYVIYSYADESDELAASWNQITSSARV